jgi:hypothetical protein
VLQEIIGRRGHQNMELPQPPKNKPRVFISYAHTTDQQREWVIEFSGSLRASGIEAILDFWDLRPGDDRIVFMEDAIATSKYVLLICTPEYAEKANARRGGVGYESMVVTGQLANSLSANKFIPILRAGDWKMSLPNWLQTRLGIDLRNDPYSPSEFEKLLRALHDRPVPAPTVGDIPDFDDLPFEKNPDTPTGPVRFVSSQHHSLSLKAKELLVTASKAPEGQITHIRHLGGEELFAGERNFLESSDARSRAEWLGALRELEISGLIEPKGGERYFFPLTAEGYALSDTFGDFVRWDAHEITLSAHYFNAPANTQEFSCGAIVELPPEYYSDDVAADGAIVRSVKVQGSLLIEKLDSKLIDSLTWNPTEASFVDPANGQTLRFALSHKIASPRGTTRLIVIGD